MIISFVNQKGGCAKSTTAVHFAEWVATQKKKKVILVDADEQKSALTWVKAMNSKVEVLGITNNNKIIDEIPELSEKAQVLVIDGPASTQETTRAILFVTDLAIIPVQPAGIDIHSTSETIHLINQAQKIRGGKPRAAAFLSRAINRSRLKQEAIAFFKELPEIPLLKSVIHQRIQVADAFGQDTTIWGMPKTLDSRKEFEKLFTEIWKLCK